jgi:hypothetical protein
VLLRHADGTYERVSHSWFRTQYTRTED